MPVSTSASSTFLATDADGYERVMGRWSRRLALPFLDFTGSAEGERVLDVGCGTGHLAFALAARTTGCQVHGVDLAAPYIAQASANNPDPQRIAFDIADACALPFADASFDRVLSLLMLHFVPQGPQAIAEMRRVCKPGGTVGAAVWDARGGFVANRLFFDTAAALDPAANAARARNYTRPMTRPGELGQAWRAEGFTNVAESALAIRMEFTSFSDYWAPYEGQEGPGAQYVGTLDTGARARLRNAVEAAYLDGEPDGPRSFAALAWAVKGVCS